VTETPSAPTGPQAAGGAGDLLRVENLVKHFTSTRGVVLSRTAGQVRAVDGLSFSIRRGETLGLVGETGCGKSTTGRVLAGFLPATSGRVTFDGRDVEETRRGRRHSLHREIQMIFQDPYSALNPRHTVGTIIAAPFRYQGIVPPGGSVPRWRTCSARWASALSTTTAIPGSSPGASGSASAWPAPSPCGPG